MPILSRKAEIILEQINRLDSLDEILHLAVRVALEETGADRASVLVLDERGQVTHKALARPGQLPEVAAVNVVLVMTEGLAGWVQKYACSDFIPDTQFDDRWVNLPDDDWETRSVMGIRIPFEDRTLGIMTLQHEEPGAFNESHLRRGDAIAQGLAAVLEKARLLEMV